MEKESLYFIAIIPAREIRDDITAFRSDFAQRFGSKAALKIIPHITLKAPFKQSASSHISLQQWFQNLDLHTGPFQIELKNFGAFPNKNPVVYVRPLINAPLYSLQKAIITNFLVSFPDLEVRDVELDFHPHITVAYRDLKYNEFIEAWKEYQEKEYNASLYVDSFHLLQHDGKKWNIIDTFFLR